MAQSRREYRRALRAYRQANKRRWDGNPSAYWSKPVAVFVGVAEEQAAHQATVDAADEALRQMEADDDAPPDDNFSGYHEKTITIGIYDTLEEAIEEGNKIIELLSEHFKIKAEDRFKLHHLWGYPKRLVVDSGYNLFAKIDKLRYETPEGAIKEVFEARKRYKEYEAEEVV